jgi:hypothetical protein
VTRGIIVARTLRRKMKITNATRSTASMMVLVTAFTDSSMNTDESKASSRRMPSGNVGAIAAISLRTATDRSSALAVDWRITPSETDGRPLKRVMVRSEAGASSTLATSRMRTWMPPPSRIIAAPNCSGVARSVWESTANSRARDSIRPAGISTFCRRNASSTSCGVRR